jgi:hypothetical protein
MCGGKTEKTIIIVTNFMKAFASLIHPPTSLGSKLDIWHKHKGPKLA